jgi:hypothetical protein
MVTAACHLPQSWATWIHSIPSYPVFLRSILILFSHQCLGCSSSLFPSAFHTKSLYACLISYICVSGAPMPSAVIETTWFCSVHSANREVPNFVIFSAILFFLFLGLNTSHSTVFLKTPSLWSSLYVAEQVSHPCTATIKIIVLHILVFILVGSRLEDKGCPQLHNTVRLESRCALIKVFFIYSMLHYK